MPHRIEVKFKVPDGRARNRQKKLEGMGLSVNKVELVDVYTIKPDLSAEELRKVADSLINPVVMEASIGKPLAPQKFRAAVEVGFWPGVTDNVGNTTKKVNLEDLLKRKFEGQTVFSSQETFVDGELSQEEIAQIPDALSNPVIERTQVKDYHSFVEYRGMGVTVPEVKLDAKPTADIVDILGADDNELKRIGKMGIFDHSRKIPETEFNRLKRKYGENELKLSDLFGHDGSFFENVRRGPLALVPNNDLAYMKTIQNYFRKKKRNPTDVELESIAQTWSEHCKHTIFRDPIDDIKDGLFKHFIKRATDEIRKKKSKRDFCVSVFTDNSGAVEFDDEFLITHKVETHNSPSALDPRGGSVTGIVGVNRDAMGFGLGAKPIINTYGFCFGNPRDTRRLYRERETIDERVVLSNPMLSPRRILEGVVEGVNFGGNCSGIPTPQGFVLFDDRFRGKPLVFVGTVGLIPKKSAGRLSHIKKANAGDYIVMLGGRVGKDGIHGATFSSEALSAGSPATAVQIGDPITQKKMSDVLIQEARDRKLYTYITDNGAGGLSCSVPEMANDSKLGCRVKLDKVPLKYPGLKPWEIWISESQERMTLAVPKKKWKEFSELMQRRDVEATIIGELIEDRKCIVEYNGKKVMDVDMEFLHEGLPPRPMKTAFTKTPHVNPVLPLEQNVTAKFEAMLGRLNIASFEFISQQYDHEVQGGSIIKPLQGKGRVNGDATVTKPILDSKKAVVLSQGINPWYSDIDSYDMAACAIDTAVRNAVAAGASLNHLSLLDNFCWCSPDDPERLGQLKRAAEACYDYSVAYGTPFISGKDSMYNDFNGFDEKGEKTKISIPPTLLISSIGVMKDADKAVSLYAKFAGDFVYVLGETRDELGASEYYSMLGLEPNAKEHFGHAPKVDAAKNRRVYAALEKTINEGVVASAQSVHRGGLAVALAKTSIGGMLGMDISLQNLPGYSTRDDYSLFSESAGRVVLTVAPQNQGKFEQLMQGNSFAKIGTVREDNAFVVTGRNGNEIVRTNLDVILESYKAPLRDY